MEVLAGVRAAAGGPSGGRRVLASRVLHPGELLLRERALVAAPRQAAAAEHCTACLAALAPPAVGEEAAGRCAGCGVVGFCAGCAAGEAA
jgi:hypothetical protein